jgi:hypothetical protein
MEAVGLWTLAGSHCMAYLTDGFVADWWVKEKPKGVALAKRLVAAGLWRVGECAGDQGYWFHDWKPECLKVNVLAAREKARLRKARSRESHSESRVTDAETPATCLVPTQPNPTQPINPLETFGGGVTQVDAQEPPPRCSKHMNHTDPPNCHRCGDARKANEAWHANDFQRRLDAKTAAAAALDNCPRCEGTNTYTDADGRTYKCNPHQEAVNG